MSDELCLSCVRELKAIETSGNGRPFASLLVVKKLAAKTASNGNAFFSIDLGDRTGSFGCTIFSDSPVFEILKSAGEGAVVRVEGKIDFYQGRLSPKITKATLLSESELGAPGLLENLSKPHRKTPTLSGARPTRSLKASVIRSCARPCGRCLKRSAMRFAGHPPPSPCITPIVMD